MATLDSRRLAVPCELPLGRTSGVMLFIGGSSWERRHHLKATKKAATSTSNVINATSRLLNPVTFMSVQVNIAGPALERKSEIEVWRAHAPSDIAVRLNF